MPVQTRSQTIANAVESVPKTNTNIVDGKKPKTIKALRKKLSKKPQIEEKPKPKPTKTNKPKERDIEDYTFEEILEESKHGGFPLFALLTTQLNKIPKF